MNDDDRILVLLQPCDGVHLAMSDTLHDFVRSVEGCDDGEYVTRPRTCLYTLSPEPAHGRASQAVSGFHRRFSSNPISMWRPRELPATLTLNWDHAFAMGDVRVTFDTLSRSSLGMPFENGRRMSPQCVTAFTVEALRAGVVVKNIRFEDNHNRVARLDLEGAEVDTLNITLEQTHEPGALPGVYDVRVHAG